MPVGYRPDFDRTVTRAAEQERDSRRVSLNFGIELPVAQQVFHLTGAGG